MLKLKKDSVLLLMGSEHGEKTLKSIAHGNQDSHMNIGSKSPYNW